MGMRSGWQVIASVVIVSVLAACGGGGGDGAPENPDIALVTGSLSAASGGTITAPGNEVVLTIPAGALDKDTMVSVVRLATAPTLAAPMLANGNAYSVTFSNGAVLTKAMQIAIKATAMPQHPSLGEIAVVTASAATRLPANFYRRADNVVIGRTTDTGTFMPIARRLQVETGASVARGRDIFLGETFGNESFFGGVLGLHTLLNDLTPAQAVGVGVQVDLAKVPAGIVAVLTGADLGAKDAALQNPAVTRALIKAGAVVGVKGVYADASSDRMTAAGITCALCHVNVTPTQFELTGGKAALPIGNLALDGIPNSKMDAGAILSLTPFVAALPATAKVLQGWGPGRFDIRALPDNPLDDGVDNPTRFPPLWNFVDLEAQVFPYDWDGLFKSTATPNNSLASQAEAVYDLVMHANGAFGTASGTLAPLLAGTPPADLIAALGAAESAAPGNVIPLQALLDVQSFERSIASPAPGAYDEALAQQGFDLFNDKARCSGCHRTAEFTGPVVSTKITITPPTGALAGGIKTPGLRGIASHAPYFHDGSAATLRAVVDTYSGRVVPELTASEKDALVEYLKSL
jgi:hypothetical protein